MTKKKIVYIVLEVLFIAIAPLTLLLIEYGNIGNTKLEVGFKLSFLGSLLAIVVFILAKKMLVNKWLSNLTTKIARFEGDVATKPNGEERDNAVRELKKARTMDSVINAILPILILLLALIMCKGLESALVKLSGVVGFVLVSFAIGTVFNVLAAREVTKRND